MQQSQNDLNESTTQRAEATVQARVAAFEEVYLRYGPRLRQIAVRRFKIDRTEAAALVHDVFATYLMQVDSVQKIEQYLIGAICNAARYHLRQAGVAEAVFCNEEPCAATPDDTLAATIERKVLLTRMLARIGSHCRELLHRYYVNGETTQDIACSMQTSTGTVSVILHQCRRRARSAYHDMTERN